MAKRMIIITVPAGNADSKDVKNRQIFTKLGSAQDFLSLRSLPKLDSFGLAMKNENSSLPSCYSVLGSKKVGAEMALDQDHHFGAYFKSPPTSTINYPPPPSSRADSYTSSVGGESDFDEEEFGDEMGEAEESDEISDYRTVPVRKRQRLTHLTPEEKLNRRKLKNRMAAHTARERRKAFMSDLEREYRRLRFENDGLKSRNTQIKQDIRKLSEENEALKRKMVEKREDQPKIACQQTSAAATIAGNVVGPAASINGPQQQAWTFPPTAPSALSTPPGLTAALSNPPGLTAALSTPPCPTAALSPPPGLQKLLGWLLTLTASMLACCDCCANSSPSMDDVFGERRWPLVLAKISQMQLDDQSKLILTKKMERLKEVWNSQQQKNLHQHHLYPT